MKKENNKINKTLTRDGLGRKNDKLLFSFAGFLTEETLYAYDVKLHFYCNVKYTLSRYL